MNDLNILILEDDIIIYMHIKQTLKNLGFKNIYIASDANTAIELALDTKIDLLFSDIKINGNMDGIDTVKYLQNIYSLAVVFITAYSDKNILSRVSKIDYVGFLLKPYRIDELKAFVNLSILKHDLTSEQRIININDYSFDKKSNQLYENDEEIYLTKKERRLLCILIENLDSYVEYNIVESIVWYEDMVTASTIRTFYSRFRKKFNTLNIKTQRSVGIGIFLDL